MAEQVVTGFILIGGFAGIAMGLYGIAPAFFRRRLKRAPTHDEDWTYADEDGAPEPAYTPTRPARPAEQRLFGLPSAWREPAPSIAAQPFDGHPPLFEEDAPLPESEVSLPAPDAIAFENDALPEESREVLDIFNEVLRAPPAKISIARAASSAADLAAVEIRDLLLDARWTALALRPRARGVSSP